MVVLATVLQVVSASSKCTGANASCWPSDDELEDLGKSLSGDLYLPNKVLDWCGWSKATYLHNKRIDQKPSAAIMAETAADVQAVVSFAFARNLLLSVKSTGHCYSGNCMSDDSLHLDLSRMNNVTVVTDAMMVFIEPGSNFDALYSAADAAEVLAAGGMCGTVGPVGFSLGGGHGPLGKLLLLVL